MQRSRRTSVPLNRHNVVELMSHRRYSLSIRPNDATVPLKTLEELQELAAPRTQPPSSQPRHQKLQLLDLPTEILDQILSHCIDSPSIYVQRRDNSAAALTSTDIATGAVRTSAQWCITGYPTALLLVNQRISALAFARIWCSTAFILCVSAGDALCFLKHTLSERQRLALRRVRFTRFMLSCEDGVGDDVWLAEWKRAPGFLNAVQGSEGRPVAPRVNCLVSHLAAGLAEGAAAC